MSPFIELLMQEHGLQCEEEQWGHSKDNSMLVGMELEFAHSGERPVLPRAMFKKDGSLVVSKRCMEAAALITLPMEASELYQYIDRLKDFFQKTNAYIPKRHPYGIHFNIDRNNFTHQHFIRFVNFFVVAKEFVIKNAGRRPNRYCRYPKKVLTPWDRVVTAPYNSRYRAVNLYNEDTIEVRVFQSSTDVAQIKEYLLWLRAVFLYTKEHTTYQIMDDFDYWSPNKLSRFVAIEKFIAIKKEVQHEFEQASATTRR